MSFRSPGARLALLVVSMLALQVGAAGRVRIEGVGPDLPLVLTLAAALVGGRERGAVVGFVAGLSFDVVLTSPLGLSALSYCLCGYVVGAVGSSALRNSWWVPMAAWLGGSALGVGLFAVIGEVLGQAQLVSVRLPLVMAVVAGWSAILGPLALRAMRWVDDDRDRPLLLRPVGR